MATITPNRNYPYSTPGDRADVPFALQALAEAIDVDLCALSDGVAPRQAARIRGTGTYASPTPSVAIGSPPFPSFNRVPFDTIDFDTVGVELQSQDPLNRLVKPTVAGFYFAIATVFVPTLTTSGVTVSFLDISINRGNASSPANTASRQASSSYNDPVNLTSDNGVRVFSVSSGGFFNGTTDAFSLNFRADTSPNVSSYPIGERSLTILRMTQS